MSTSILCPYPTDPRFGGVRFTGKSAAYAAADTWYPAWDAEGQLYSPYADGIVGEHRVLCTTNKGIHDFSRDLGPGGNITTGHAVIRGDDPLALTVEALPPATLPTPRFHGLYPSASFIHDGIWYCGSYYLHRWTDPAGRRITYELGPFQGFRLSRNRGQTWQDCPHTDAAPLFGERGRCAGELPIRFGAPHVVDFGRNLQHSPDGFVYLVGHGSRFAGGVANWIAGDAAFLCRVRPSPAIVNDPAAYEFFAGCDPAGQPRWAGRVADSQPIIEWPWRCGCINVTWFPALRQYIACIAIGAADGGGGTMDTWLAIADNLWGPWRQLAYLEAFGSQAYFTCIPSKFLSPDNRSFWMFWSANWHLPAWQNPPGSSYSLSVGEFDLMPPGKRETCVNPFWMRKAEEW